MRTRFCVVFMVVLYIFLSELAFADTEMELLLELLAKKGVITEEEIKSLKAEVKRKMIERQRDALELKLGKEVRFKVSGFGQVRYQYSENAVDDFDVSRARIKINGKLGDRISLFSQLDTTLDNILCDYWIQFDYSRYISLRVGQFCIPFGWQTPISPYNLLTVDYSQVISNLNGGGDLRDQGLMFSGEVGYLNYVLAVTNGEGRNESDENDQKAFVGRVGLRPIKGFEWGVSGYYGDRGQTRYTRKRIGTDIRYNYGVLLLQGEYIHSDDDTINTAIESESHTLPGEGYFIEVGYKIIPTIQPVMKYDVWDPDVKGNYGKTVIYGVGLNWYFAKQSKLQAIYEIKREEHNEIDNDVFIVQLGVNF